MKLLSPVTYRSKPPSANTANTMLDMVSNSPSYLTISQELKTVLFKCVEGIAIDTMEWNNLMEEYLQGKKRYKQYPFSYACFEALVCEQIQNSIKNQLQYTVQWGENQTNPGIVTFTNPDCFEEFLWGLPRFDELYNESMGQLIQSTHSATAQLLFEIKKGDQEKIYTFEYRIFILLERGMQYEIPLVQLMLSDTVVDIQNLYTLFMQFLPDGVSIHEGLYRVPKNQLLQQEVFDQRANDDEKSQYAKLFDPNLSMILNVYCNKTLPQDTKRELFHKVCQNEGWCFFIKQANVLFTYSTLESSIIKRPMDTFRLFAPDRDEKKATITFTGQQRNKEMKDMINMLNSFLNDKILWRQVNSLPYKTIGLVIVGEVIDNETVNIAITFGGTKLQKNKHNYCAYQEFSLDQLYQLLTALQLSDHDFDRDTIDPFYLGYEPDDYDQEGLNDEDYDDNIY